jgi:hypothetical protein
MADTSNWKLYDAAKRELCDGTFNATGLFYASLFTSSSNAADPTLKTLTEVTNEVPRVNGYGGAMPITTSWDVIANGMRFNFAPFNWTAVGGSMISTH